MRVSISFTIFLFLIFFSFNSYSVVKGSESAVSVEPLAVFPQADGDNTMLGFGWFKNGFTLEDSSTTCTFDSVYQVSGTADLNGGSLYLTRDFILSNTSSLTGGGNIYADNYIFEFCSSITSMSSTFTFHDAIIYLNGNLEISDNITFEGSCFLNGGGYHINFASGGAFFVADNSTISICDTEIVDIENGKIICCDDNSKLILKEASLLLSGDFTFDCGSIEFEDLVEFKGSYTFLYDSSQTSTINQDSKWVVTDGMTLKIGRKDVIDYVEPLNFIDETSIIMMDDCSFVVTESGIHLTRGTIELDREVWIDVLASTTTYGMIIGNGIEADDFSMKLDSGASVHLNSGYWVYNNYNSYGKLHPLSEFAHCLRYENSKFYLMRDWIIPPMIFKVVSGNPELVMADGVTLRYNNTQFLSNSTAEFYILGESSPSTFYLKGDDHIFIHGGMLMMPIYVSGSGNKIHGSGLIGGGVTLQDENSDVCCQLNGCFCTDFVLGSGTLMLMGDLDLETDTIISGSGTVNISKYRVNFGPKDDEWDSDIMWQGNGGCLEFKAGVDLSGTWTFTGACSVHGGGHVLSMVAGGNIVAGDGAALTLRNLILEGISDNQLRCLSDSSTIILDNVKWIQDGNFTFTSGSLEFKNEVVMAGDYVFAYQSTQTSIICSWANLIFDSGFTFSYDPGLMSKTLIDLEDDTSYLTLNGATLHSTVTGMQLSKGNLIVLRDSFLFSEIQTVLGFDDIDEGISFGNGIGAEDLRCEIENGVTLKLNNGSLNYRNLDSSFMKLDNVASTLYIDSNSRLNLYESISLDTGRIVFGNCAVIGRALGKDITGSICPLGELLHDNL